MIHQKILLQVSIHAPVWVRLPPPEKLRHSTSFNSRTRVGATPNLYAFLTLFPVSIHAPVWVRPVTRFSATSAMMFQFTHPCGCDLYFRPSMPRTGGFNSRTRVGATFFTRPGEWEELVSIHAPVWVRRQKRIVTGRDMEFQFTHPCGCDLMSGTMDNLINGFNSRTRVGATNP